MHRGSLRIIGLALFVAVAASPVLATNGYFSHGYGTASKGMAGAGAALPLDTLAPATNPAGVVFVDPGLDMGIGVFSPDREYDVDGQPSGFPGTFGLAPGTVRSGSRFFPLPHFGLVRKAGAHGAWGVAMYGNGGMNTNYGSPTFGVAPAGVDLSQMFIAPTYALKLNERHAIGVTGLIAYQRFEAKGLQAFSAFSQAPTALTDLDHSNSYGGGVRVGYLGQWSKYLSFGASYQMRVWMSEFDTI
jgi:long-chain fatty acid transport protein